MSAMQIIILHPYISLKFAYMADSPSQRWPTPPGMKTSPGPAMDYGVWTVTALAYTSRDENKPWPRYGLWRMDRHSVKQLVGLDICPFHLGTGV